MLQSQKSKKMASQTVYESGFAKQSPPDKKQAVARQNSAVDAKQKISKLN